MVGTKVSSFLSTSALRVENRSSDRFNKRQQMPLIKTRDMQTGNRRSFAHKISQV
jgi:hypothetical protein